MLESALLSIGFPELDRGNGWPLQSLSHRGTYVGTVAAALQEDGRTALDEEGLENPALVPP